MEKDEEKMYNKGMFIKRKIEYDDEELQKLLILKSLLDFKFINMKEKEQNARRYKGKIKILKFKSLFFVLKKEKGEKEKKTMDGYVFLPSSG